jgi:hypothetical protein
MGTLNEDLCTFMTTPRSVLVTLRIFRTKVVEKIKIQILCSITFFPENRAVYEIM